VNTKIYSHSELKNILDFIEKLVGHEWMEDWVHGMRDNFGRLPQNVPPLAISWLKAKDELAAYELTDRLMVSESTARLLQLGNNLNLLKGIEDFDYQISLLKGNVKQYSAACYRIFIAANYYQRKVEFKFSQYLTQPDLTLANGNEEIPVVTIAPVLETTSLLFNKVHTIIKNAVARLPIGEGIIYIDYPLPPGFSPEQLVKEISKQSELVSLGENVFLIVTISYREKPHLPEIKHSMFALKQNSTDYKNTLL
jgi:hypothetical protein